MPCSRIVESSIDAVSRFCAGCWIKRRDACFCQSRRYTPPPQRSKITLSRTRQTSAHVSANHSFQRGGKTKSTFPILFARYYRFRTKRFHCNSARHKRRHQTNCYRTQWPVADHRLCAGGSGAKGWSADGSERCSRCH